MYLTHAQLTVIASAVRPNEDVRLEQNGSSVTLIRECPDSYWKLSAGRYERDIDVDGNITRYNEDNGLTVDATLAPLHWVTKDDKVHAY